MNQHGPCDLDMPRAVRNKALALGGDGQRWLEQLPALVRGLAQEWRLSLGSVLHGGSAACVVVASTEEGTPAILKVHLPGYDSLSSEIGVLRAADGNGYARLLRADEGRGAVLLERLGPPLGTLGLPVERQITILCATLQRAWLNPPGAYPFHTGADKARWLHDFISSTWQRLDRPCSERVIDRALAYCLNREAAHDPDRAVLCHGDAHGANTLAPLDATTPDDTAFTFIDPDGLLAERACDLATLMRDWAAELLAGDPLALGRQRRDLLCSLTGENPEAIWQWGFMERVSTGLLLMQTNEEREGRQFLRVAEAWAVSSE